MVGRKPVPTALKLLRGNPGKRRLNELEPRPEAAVPRCPAFLDGEARKEWRRLSRRLAGLGLLTEIDRGQLAAYCEAWGRYVDAVERVRKTGLIIHVGGERDKETGNVSGGFWQQSPFVGVLNKALEQLRTMAAEFGMTPSSRTRIHAAPKPENAKDEERFFGRRA